MEALALAGGRGWGVLERRVRRRQTATLCSVFNPTLPSIALGHMSGHVSFHLASA